MPIGLLAGRLLSAAVALMLVRGLLGAELAFVSILTTLYATLLGMSAATVMRATRVLYAHAQTGAQMATAARRAAGDARLAALQARMNPHFLFNALNSGARRHRRRGALQPVLMFSSQVVTSRPEARAGGVKG